MARYTVHVPESAASMGIDHPWSELEAYTKVCKLRAAGFDVITLKNVDTGEQITDVESVVLDSPDG